MISWIATGLGLTASLGLLMISAAMNYRFGLTLGTTDFDASLYGLLSVCADMLKALLPFVIMLSWQTARWVMAVMALSLWLIFTAYSFASGLGFAALNRTTLTSERTVTAGQYAELNEAIGNAKAQHKALPAHRSIIVASQELSTLKRHRRWIKTSQCSNATVPLSRAFCRQIHTLEGEIKIAQEASRLRGQIERLQRQRAALPPSAAMPSVDPQLAILKRLTGLAPDQLGFALSLLVAVLVEFGSGLGPYLVTAFRCDASQIRLLRQSTQARRQDEVEDFQPLPNPKRLSVTDTPEQIWKAQRLSVDANTRTALTSLYSNYLTWCTAEQIKHPLTLTAFTSWIADHPNVRLVKSSTGTYALGVEAAVYSRNADGPRPHQHYARNAVASNNT
ncbi:MAG: hypothetical protein AAFV69_14060 [Pseudomonadota bacterium]